jgi:hypothetical protein
VDSVKADLAIRRDFHLITFLFEAALIDVSDDRVVLDYENLFHIRSSDV